MKQTTEITPPELESQSADGPRFQIKIGHIVWSFTEFTEELAIEWLEKACWSIAESGFLLSESCMPVSNYAGYPLPPECTLNKGAITEKLIRALQARQLTAINRITGSVWKDGLFPVYSPADVISVAESLNIGKWQNWKERQRKYSETKQAAPAAKVEAVTATNPSGDTWRKQARAIGEKVCKEQPSLNVERIAAKVFAEMTTRKEEQGMTGRGGKVPSADTIKRHALTGIKS